ncbi:hypothetical protein [uncultured Rikenella sp.]|uniref:hypothetical protein n=1 Tax=uncultured Rikenella sp. TaxID=368003 RepID=UPI002607D121|nr:hypothetical protein [uncultured Rikenella sp.]
MGDWWFNGQYGFVWSSTVYGISAYFLDFGPQVLNPCHTDDRAYGLQLRCLSE